MLCSTQNDLNQLSHVRRMYAEIQDHRYSRMRYTGLKQRLYTHKNFEVAQKISILTQNMGIFLRQLTIMEIISVC